MVTVNYISAVLAARDVLIVTLLAAIVATMLVLALTSGASTGAENEAAWLYAYRGVPSNGGW